MQSALRRLFVIALYFVSSVVTTILNKLVISTLGFRMHYLFIVIQSGAVVLMVGSYYLATSTRPSIKKNFRWVVTSFFLCLMILSNMKSLYYFPVNLFTLYKNLSIVPTAILEGLLFNKPITWPGAFSLGLLILSSFTAQIVDQTSITGYLWMLLNLLSTTAYMLYLKHVMDSGSASKTDSVFFTNLFCLPPLILFSCLFDPLDFSPASPLLVMLIALSSVCVFLTAFSTAWTLQVVSSTVVSVMGALNKVCLSAAGFLFFAENPTFLKMASIFTGIVASCYYSYDSVKVAERLSIPVVPASREGG